MKRWLCSKLETTDRQHCGLMRLHCAADAQPKNIISRSSKGQGEKIKKYDHEKKKNIPASR